MSQQSIEVTIVGSSNVDITSRMQRIPRPGETVLAESYQLIPGGKGANQALAAQLAGAATEFIGAVGRDAHAGIALGQLEAAGVRLDRVARVEAPTGVAIIQVDAQAENTIAVVPGANGTVDACAVAAAGELHGIVVLQGEIPASGISAAIAAAGSRVVLNLAPVIELPRADLLAANPLVVNEHEAALVLAQLDSAAVPAGQDEPAIAQALLEHGIASVVITLGGEGCLVADGTGVAKLPALKVEAVDTTGAGDAFTGALAASLARGESLAQAAEFAGRFAAATVRSYGAQASYPRSLDEL